MDLLRHKAAWRHPAIGVSPALQDVNEPSPGRPDRPTFVRRVIRAPGAPGLVGVLLMLLMGPGLAAQSGPAPAIKAALVYNFAKFADWPAETLPNSGALVLCVIDSTGVADALADIVHGQTVGGHPFTVRRVTTNDDLRSCHLLYVSGFDAKRYLQLLGPLKDAAVLTISDCEQFALLGGVANLYIDNNRLRFAINLESARRSKLVLSSRLLSLAKVVNDPSSAVH